MKRGIATIIVFIFVLSFSIYAASAIGSEKPAYEKFKYSMPVRSNWTNTLSYIDVGEVVRFTGSGFVKPTKESPLIGPAGLGEEGAGEGFNCPDLPAYSLIAKIGKYGNCFLIGEENQATPSEPGFMFFAVNSKDEIRKATGGAGKFDILVEIYRPTCGDGVCEEGESGYCAEDCDWCGDDECNAEETCETCSKDCGFCEGDITTVEERAEEYFRLLQENDFVALVDITTGDFKAYYDEFKRFEREFQKSIDMLGIDKENELLPKFQFESISAELDEMTDGNAIVNAVVDEKSHQFKLVKEDGEWKLKDMREADEEEWFTSDLDLKALRDNHNDYLSKITEEEGLTPKEIKVDATTTKAPMKLIIITVVVILIFFGAIYFIFVVMKKRKRFDFSFFKKLKLLKKSKKIKEAKKEKVEKTKKKKGTEIEDIGGEGKCPKCKAEIFAHERFCVKCGTKLKKKK
ncbi:MAG: hypothetical protein KAT43_00300 [Nanoarchaeota archaeon]|nr:hypothetical protein [Nanoarchaeota archaeon]